MTSDGESDGGGVFFGAIRCNSTLLLEAERDVRLLDFNKNTSPKPISCNSALGKENCGNSQDTARINTEFNGSGPSLGTVPSGVPHVSTIKGFFQKLTSVSNKRVSLESTSVEPGSSSKSDNFSLKPKEVKKEDDDLWKYFGAPSFNFAASMEISPFFNYKGSSTSLQPEKVKTEDFEFLHARGHYRECHCNISPSKKFILVYNKVPNEALPQVERGTTTLAFIFKDAISFPKLVQITSHIVATISGGSEYLLSNLKRKCDEELKGGKTVVVEKVAKWLADDLAPQGLSVGVLIGGWGDDGPVLYQVNHRGEVVKKKRLSSTGSGSSWARVYVGFRWHKMMSETDAEDLAKDAICYAACKALYSGDFASVYRVGSSGCQMNISGFDIGKWRNENKQLWWPDVYEHISAYPPY
ncbi:OLC1v1019453C1 [Oldenlandia corymbosa var. corymbosa]|uniref:OLC1v1019453C1 n=1 Tax=Oldenlandia corymbosa var. corymbosa TaxID=529605 RepID=A0AAV1EE03_OLDCO|nr:OLC1v1019453C1 [Oldenlandia corymbosa var. corymbosa]